MTNVQSHDHAATRGHRLLRGATTLAAAATLAALAGPALLGSTASAQEKGQSEPQARKAPLPPGPIVSALSEVDAEVVTYNDHLTILASPWMGGRLPGTRGMELAKEYVEYHYDKFGLERPYAESGYRQRFELAADSTFNSSSMVMRVGDETLSFEHGRKADYTACYLGQGGEASAPLAFVGFAIDGKVGDTSFSSFHEGQDLTGKIAVMLRFEPFGEDGKSLLGARRWSPLAGFQEKLSNVKERGAAAVVIINPPGASDTRRMRLLPPPQSRRSLTDVPVFHVSIEAGERFIDFASKGAETLENLVRAASEGPVDVDLHGTLEMKADIDRKEVYGENMVGVLPGRGALAKESIIVGAHLDHLGMGDFGSRDREFRGKALHPGADDNASGAAGILLIAQKLAKDYAAMPEDQDRRTVVFVAFTAEESGLHGADHYADNPVGSQSDIALMMNFDMIGRMKDSRLSLSGTRTARGMHDFIQPIVDASPLTVVQQGRSSGGSDHAEFLGRGIPILFAIIKDFHPDYHTSRDVSSLINRVEAVHAANLFYEIAKAYAVHGTRFPFQSSEAIEEAERQAAAGGVPRSRVRLGVRPKYDEEAGETGVLVEDVSDASPAKVAGLRAGDRIISFDGEELDGPRELGGFLSKCDPGQKVTLRVRRDGEELDLEVTLAENPFSSEGR